MIYAEGMCGLIKTHYTFKPCHNDIDPSPYYDNCLYDVCECDTSANSDCLCNALAIYVEECSYRGIYLDWRVDGVCGK